MTATRKARVPMSEQIRLINECRRSGMTDADWCRKHDIAPSTFYNWIHRCRKAASDQIPAPSYGHHEDPQPRQDVVAVDIVPDRIPELAGAPAALQADTYIDNSHTIEIAIKDLKIRITNGTDPILLSRILRMLREFLC